MASSTTTDVLVVRGDSTYAVPVGVTYCWVIEALERSGGSPRQGERLWMFRKGSGIQIEVLPSQYSSRVLYAGDRLIVQGIRHIDPSPAPAWQQDPWL